MCSCHLKVSRGRPDFLIVCLFLSFTLSGIPLGVGKLKPLILSAHAGHPSLVAASFHSAFSSTLCQLNFYILLLHLVNLLSSLSLPPLPSSTLALGCGWPAEASSGSRRERDWELKGWIDGKSFPCGEEVRSSNRCT